MEVLKLCLMIFFVRIFDVSLATVCTIYTVKGQKKMAAIIGFIDVLAWFLMARTAINSAGNNLWVAISYAGGYAVGTYIGCILSDKFITGTLSLKIVLSNKDDKIVEEIRDAGYAVTVTEASGKDSNKYMLFMDIDKKKLNKLETLIKKLDKDAFIVVTETAYVANGFIK